MPNTISRRDFLTVGAGGLLTLAPSPPAAVAAIAPGGDIRSRFIAVRGALPVPAVPVPLINGKLIELASLRGSLVIVNLWATWCPGCREELPALQNLAAKRIPGLEVLAVAADREPRKTVADFAKMLGLSKLAIGLAPDPLVSRKDAEQRSPFVLYAMPITYLIGRSGAVEGYFLGQVDWSGDEVLTMLEGFR